MLKQWIAGGLVMASLFVGHEAQANTVRSIVQADDFLNAAPVSQQWYAVGVTDGISLVLDVWIGQGVACPNVPASVLANAAVNAVARIPVNQRYNRAAVDPVIEALFAIGCQVVPSP